MALWLSEAGHEESTYKAFIEAGRQAGYPVFEDYNGFRQEGFGPMQMTVKNGQRWSTASAYLKPALKRANVAVLTHALALRIVIEQGRAIGVEIERGGKRKSSARGARWCLRQARSARRIC